MTCEAPLGVCRLLLRHGPVDRRAWSRRAWPSASSPPSRSASRARSSRCGRSTSAASVSTSVEESEIKAKKGGIVKFTRMQVVTNDEGQNVVLTRNGEISLLDAKGRELEKYEVPNGAILLVDENQTVKAGQVLCEWDPHSMPILAEVGGKVRFEDIDRRRDAAHARRTPAATCAALIMEHKGDLHPQIVIEDDERQDPRRLLPPGTGPHRGRRRQQIVGRHAAGQDAARSVAARRTSPAVCRA